MAGTRCGRCGGWDGEHEQGCDPDAVAKAARRGGNVQPNCLMKDCKNKAGPDYRGLCMKHYSQAKKQVEAGKTTWLELEQLGLAASKGKAEDEFVDELERRRAEAQHPSEDK